MRPSVPTSHPALGLAKATAQNPLTPGNVNQVFPSSGVQAAVPVVNVGASLAVITTARPRLSPAPRVAIHAFRPPCVVTHVPLDAKENSPVNAGGMLLLMSCHVIPLVVRKSGNTPSIESPCRIPRCGVQNAKPS